MHISSVIKISFCRISFSGHQNKFCACLDSIYGSRVILVMCKNCSDIRWHRLNSNQSKTNCPKNLNSDGLIVREMGPWPECIFRSLLQFLVIITLIRMNFLCQFLKFWKATAYLQCDILVPSHIQDSDGLLLCRVADDLVVRGYAHCKSMVISSVSVAHLGCSQRHGKRKEEWAARGELDAYDWIRILRILQKIVINY